MKDESFQEPRLERSLERLEGRGIAFADIRYTVVVGTRMNLATGGLRSAVSSESRGCAGRVYAGDGCHFAFCSGFAPKKVSKMLLRSVSENRLEPPVPGFSFQPVSARVYCHCEMDPRLTEPEEKLDFLARIERNLRTDCGGLAFIEVQYIDQVVTEHVVNTLGSRVETEVSSIYLILRATVKKDGRYRRLVSYVGGNGGVEQLGDLINRERGRNLTGASDRRTGRSTFDEGEFPAILSQEITGALLHEAIGHSVESDYVLGGLSPLRNKLGKQVTSENVRIFDDPTCEKLFGSYKYDSEAIGGRKNIIIENGVLKGFLHSLETAYQTRVTPTGNGRAHSFVTPPIPHSSTLFLDSGDWTLDEMIEETARGIYLEGVGKDCSVNLASGDFSIGAQRGTIIRHGRLEETFENLLICGNVVEVLNDIEAIGKDEKHALIGFCSKKGQVLPSNAVCPPVKIGKIRIKGSTPL